MSVSNQNLTHASYHAHSVRIVKRVLNVMRVFLFIFTNYLVYQIFEFFFIYLNAQHIKYYKIWIKLRYIDTLIYIERILVSFNLVSSYLFCRKMIFFAKISRKIYFNRNCFVFIQQMAPRQYNLLGRQVRQVDEPVIQVFAFIIIQGVHTHT